jgi:hypothetical protein
MGGGSTVVSFSGEVKDKVTHGGWAFGLPLSGRVVWKFGIKNCYLIFVLKKYYQKFWVSENLGSGSSFTRYTRN